MGGFQSLLLKGVQSICEHWKAEGGIFLLQGLLEDGRKQLLFGPATYARFSFPEGDGAHEGELEDGGAVLGGAMLGCISEMEGIGVGGSVQIVGMEEIFGQSLGPEDLGACSLEPSSAGMGVHLTI